MRHRYEATAWLENAPVIAMIMSAYDCVSLVSQADAEAWGLQYRTVFKYRHLRDYGW